MSSEQVDVTCLVAIATEENTDEQQPYHTQTNYTDTHTDRQTCTDTYRQTDRQIDTDRQTVIRIDIRQKHVTLCTDRTAD